ncbi:MAG: tetratricopeptide repeat protein [Candidatus Delongbacteria bacterium]|nr:tetratricopeptide repeat protein [Candidatus Delongbacteria bacterium]
MLNHDISKKENSLEELNELIKKLNITVSIIEKIELLITISDKFRVTNNLKSSLEYAQTALEIATINGLENKFAKIYNLHALYYDAIDQFDKSLDYYQKAKSICEKLNDVENLAVTMNNIGSIYFLHFDKNTSLEYFEKAVELNPKSCKAINNAANTYAQLKKYDKAEKLFLSALEIAKKKNLQRSIAICYLNLVGLTRDIGQLNRSYEYLNFAEKIINTLKNSDMWLYFLMHKSETLIANNEIEKALFVLNEILEKTKQMKSKEFQINCFDIYKRLYLKIGDYKSAYEFSQKEIEIKDELFRLKIKNKLASFHALYEVEQKELKAREMVEKSARLATIGVMAAGITHEINQPLNAISVSANSVLFWNKHNPDVLPKLFVEELEQIAKGVTRIDDIIKHMRSFWVTPNILDDTLSDFNKSIINALSLIERQLYSHGIILETNLTDKELKVRANSVNIEQIVINLVINSMHSLDESTRADKKIRISTYVDNQTCQLQIWDNGIGLQTGTEETVFDPFYSTKKPGKGMGLGLAIVKNLIIKMNGSIKAENSNKGALFTIIIPLEEAV